MVLLGYLSMVVLGLLPLAALARATGTSADRVFLIDTPYALILGFVIGLAACAILGRVLGLLTPQELGIYAERHRVESASAAATRRRHRPASRRIRSTAAAPFARFS